MLTTASVSAAPPDGLTSDEARRRLASDGPNSVPSARPRPLAVRIGRQFADPLVTLLLAAAVVTTVFRPGRRDRPALPDPLLRGRP